MKNAKLRLRMLKPPRALGKAYYYQPDIITQRNDLPAGSRVVLTRTITVRGDKTVMVKDKAGNEYRILWADLRL